MITEINESKTLTRHTSCECKWWNNGKYPCECKKHHICEKIIFGNLVYVFVKMKNN